MRAEAIDPRDTRWEHDEPAYRVYFWERSSTLPSAGWSSDEWRLSEADIDEVRTWAEQRARGRRITIWVEHDDGRSGLGMIRLLGWEPTRNDQPPLWAT